MIENIVTGTTGTYEKELKKLRLAFEEADAIIIGAGSGLSASAGYEFAGERLKKHFGDFINKYGMTDMYTGCFADFETNEERWAYWSRWAWINRYEEIPQETAKTSVRERLFCPDYQHRPYFPTLRLSERKAVLYPGRFRTLPMLEALPHCHLWQLRNTEKNDGRGQGYANTHRTHPTLSKMWTGNGL